MEVKVEFSFDSNLLKSVEFLKFLKHPESKFYIFSKGHGEIEIMPILDDRNCNLIFEIDDIYLEHDVFSIEIKLNDENFSIESDEVVVSDKWKKVKVHFSFNEYSKTEFSSFSSYQSLLFKPEKKDNEVLLVNKEELMKALKDQKNDSTFSIVYLCKEQKEMIIVNKDQFQIDEEGRISVEFEVSEQTLGILKDVNFHFRTENIKTKTVFMPSSESAVLGYGDSNSNSTEIIFIVNLIEKLNSNLEKSYEFNPTNF